ncbi:MAG: anaerobic ribonucleoside-triphosphate reductase activating protein [Candidatus Berkelbacteria bacterium]
MQIAGIQKITLVDFPGHVAATIFTRGCSFRCPFCHNPELVLPEKYSALLDEQQVFDFLETRYGKLTGICITGGEPLMQPDIDTFISHLKALSFDVKLDTNGSYPDMLEKIIKDGDVDYIAMDIKASPDKYATAAGTKIKIADVKKSIKLVMESGIDYEFRTTVCKPIHEVADFEELGKMIKGAKRYFLQNFVQSKHVNSTKEYLPLSKDDLLEAKKIMEGYVGEVGIR